MSDRPTSNVKIYDRPERKGPSPAILLVALVIVLLVGYFLFKAFYHPVAHQGAPTGILPVYSVRLHGEIQS